MIKAIVTDFGGVLTLPLNEAFARAHAELGIPIDALGQAMRHAAESILGAVYSMWVSWRGYAPGPAGERPPPGQAATDRAPVS